MKRKIVLFFTMILLSLCAIGALVACGDDGGKKETKTEFNYYYSGTSRQIDASTTRLSDSLITRSGYTFEGAFDKPNGQGKQCFNKSGYITDGTKIKNGMNIYAYWTPKVYTLVLKDGEDEFRRIPNVTYNSELSYFDVPQAQYGRVFSGWGSSDGKTFATGSDGRFLADKNFNVSSGFKLNDNTAYIYAIFGYEQYDITLNYNTLAENRVIKAYYDHAIENLPKLEPQEGYEFLGWSYENSYTNYILYDNEKITGPITLYAIVLRYREFDIFDGDNNKLATSRVYDNGVTIRLSELELELPAGYKSGNWYNNATMSGGSRITGVTYNTVTDALYVDIVPIEYTAELVVGDAVVSGDTFYTFTCEDVVPLPTAEKENYSFVGWCTDEELATTPVTRLQKGTVGDIKLYPKFKGVDVTLNLHPQNGGSESVVTREYGQVFSLDVPTKIGYTFLGWYGSEEGGTRYTGSNGKSTKEIDSTEPLNLYAHWIINEYAVSYVDGDGNSITSQTYEHGQKLVFPSDPTDETLTFSGWYNEDYSEPFTEGTKVTEDITVYALFVDSLEITTAAQLKAIGQNPSGNYHLGADINLGGETWTPINEFKGILDGKGHKIFNFGLSVGSETDNFGFFRVNNGTIKNLSFDDFTYSATMTITVSQLNFAVICGVNNGVIINCTVTNETVFNFNINASSTASSAWFAQDASRATRFILNIGAIVGSNKGLIYSSKSDYKVSVKCSLTSTSYQMQQATATTTALIYTGGIAGINDGKVTLCESQLKFGVEYNLITDIGTYAHCTSESTPCVGGIVGNNNGNGVVDKCSANVDIGISKIATAFNGKYGTSDWGYAHHYVNPFLGGIVGYNDADIKVCYATGTVKNRSTATTYSSAGRSGGIVGLNEQNGEIYDSYCDTAVISESGATDIGGFAGHSVGKIQNCYSAGSVTTNNNGGCSAGAFIGYINTKGSVTGCFTFGSITIGSNSEIGKFVGGNAGSIRKCYFGDNVVSIIGGNAANDNNRGATEKSESELLSRELLVDELFWDEEAWVIDGTNNPKLAWQD